MSAMPSGLFGNGLPRYSRHGRDAPRCAGKADDRPARLVAVSAIDWIGIHAFDHRLVQRGPERPDRQPAVELHLAGRQPDSTSSRCAGSMRSNGCISLAAMGVGGFDAGAIKLGRCQRQLIALARRALFPRPLHIKAVALAPAAGERAVDVDVDAEIGAFRADLVGRDHVIDQGLDEGGFIEIEEFIAGGLRRGRRRGCRSACAISAAAIGALAAAAPPTTAPLMKSRRSSSGFFMLPLPAFGSNRRLLSLPTNMRLLLQAARRDCGDQDHRRRMARRICALQESGKFRASVRSPKLISRLIIRMLA